MNVFIAGATGVLGLPLVRALVARGHAVTGMTRTAAKAQLLEQIGARVAVADALDRAALMAAVKEARPTHVVHLLTALPKGGPRRAADLAATNRLRTEGTANLLRAAIAAGAQRIVAESFVHVYGYGDLGATPLREDQPLPESRLEPGLQGIVDALRALETQMLAAQGQIDATVLRYGIFYGANNPGTRALLDLARKRRLPLLRGGHGLSSLIHVDDAVAATVAALERSRRGAIYNVVDDEPANFNDVIAHLATEIGAPRPYALPAWLMRLAAPAILASMQSRVPADNGQARRELEWQPRYPSFREGLAQVVDQLRRDPQAPEARDQRAIG